MPLNTPPAMRAGCQPPEEPPMTEPEALATLARAGIAAPDAALAARLMAAAQRMAAGLARQPSDLPAGLEPADAFAVPRS